MHRTHTVPGRPRGRSAPRRRDLNLSLDLIYGLPAAPAATGAAIRLALSLQPSHLSLYSLTVEASTPLARWIDRGATTAASDEGQASEFLQAHDRLTGAGFIHYEVSNYALAGFEAVHNRAYWTRSPYLGLGPSAHSALGRRRWWNIREWEEWRRTVGAGGLPIAGEELLDEEARALEDLYLGLRTERGVPETAIPAGMRGAWTRAGWAEVRGGRLMLLPEGWLRLDALVAEASPA
jgi:oxygen-independent coproporphyrinogen-3 oxidase